MQYPPLNQKSIHKEAIWPLLVGIAAILGLGGAAFGLTEAITGYQENIVADSEQLREILNALPAKYPNNPQWTSSLSQDGQQLADLCRQLLDMANQKAADQSAVGDFNNKLAAAEMLVGKIQQEFNTLIQLESIAFAPNVTSHISAVKNGIEALKNAIASVGQQASRQRQEGGRPDIELTHTPEGPVSSQPPLSAQNPPLDDEERQKVVEFLNEHYQAGTTLHNLPDRLFQISNQITMDLGVDNVTPQRLMGADAKAIGGVFWAWKNPEIAAKYKTPNLG